MAAAIADLPGTDLEDDIVSRNPYSVNLINYVNDRITNIGSYVFYGFLQLESISGSNITYIGDLALYHCNKLSSLNCPKLAGLGSYALRDCSLLTTLDMFGGNRIWDGAFQGCTQLTTLILRNTSNITYLNNGATVFVDTPIASGTGYIYVPRALLSQYQNNVTWSTLTSQLRAIEDYPEICG